MILALQVLRTHLIPYISEVTHGSVHIIHSLGLMQTRTTLNTAFLSWIQTLELVFWLFWRFFVLAINCWWTVPLSSKNRPLVLKRSQPERWVGPPALSPYTGIRNKHCQPRNCRKMSTVCSSLWLTSNCIEYPARSICSKCVASPSLFKEKKKKKEVGKVKASPSQSSKGKHKHISNWDIKEQIVASVPRGTGWEIS